MSGQEHPRDLGLFAATRAMGDGSLTATTLVRSCLDRVEARESEIRAWVELHAEEALRVAADLDRQAARGVVAGGLHGIPVGVKDVIDVRAMATRAGSAAYHPRVPDRDALAVRRLREAGAIILGKTVTTAFAGRDPGPTRNPWNTERTPGGSSSGSGAAVGDRMCLAALGTQSGGSVLRPAAYNGVVGFKPSRGAIPLDGVVPNVHELDHLGVMARDVAGVEVMFDVMRDPQSRPVSGAGPHATPAVRVWRVRGYEEAQCDAAWLGAVDRLHSLLESDEVRVEEAGLPDAIEVAREAHRTIAGALQARYFQADDGVNAEALEPMLAENVRRGGATSAADLVAALRHQRALQQAMAERLAAFDVAILPCAPGPPPRPPDTGSASFLWPFSLCGLPAVSLPAGWSDGGLPVGVQLVGAAGSDDRLLAFARTCEVLLAVEDRCPG